MLLLQFCVFILFVIIFLGLGVSCGFPPRLQFFFFFYLLVCIYLIYIMASYQILFYRATLFHVPCALLTFILLDFDSWGKPGSGILSGNVKWFGAFDQCIGIPHGKYCLVTALGKFRTNTVNMTPYKLA